MLLRDLVAAIGRAVGRELVTEQRPEQPGDVPITCADLTRSEAELGYRPRVSLEEGLALFVEWFRHYGWQTR